MCVLMIDRPANNNLLQARSKFWGVLVARVWRQYRNGEIKLFHVTNSSPRPQHHQ